MPEPQAVTKKTSPIALKQKRTQTRQKQKHPTRQPEQTQMSHKTQAERPGTKESRRL